MPDTRPPQADPGRPRIEVGSEADLAHWARKLNATPEQIKEAVAAVGELADEVEMHLKGTRSSSNADAARRSG